MASSLTSSDIPNDLARLDHYFQILEQMLADCFEDYTSTTPQSPISTAIPFDRVFVNVDRCQRDLVWDLPDDIWTDDLEEWIERIPYFPIQIHPATTTNKAEISRWPSSTSSTTSSERTWRRTFPSFELPPLDLFTDFRRQEPALYSPSVYSQDDFAFNQAISHPLGDTARALQNEISMAPINYISLEDLLAITPKMHDICDELRATINRAEDSTEFDSDSGSDSDVSALEFNSSSDLSINITRIADSRGLRISSTSTSTTTPSSTSNSNSNPSSTRSYIRVRNHPISPDIRNRLSLVAATRGLTIHVLSPQHGCALLTDETVSRN